MRHFSHKKLKKYLTRKLVNDMLMTRILVIMTKKLVKIWWGGVKRCHC